MSGQGTITELAGVSSVFVYRREGLVRLFGDQADDLPSLLFFERRRAARDHHSVQGSPSGATALEEVL